MAPRLAARVLAWLALATPLPPVSSTAAHCHQPIQPFFSAPLSPNARRPSARTVNHSYGAYLLLTEPPHEEEQQQQEEGRPAGSWSTDGGSELVPEPVAAEDWTVMVYCRDVPGLLLGRIELQARMRAEDAGSGAQQTAAALESGTSLVAMDDVSLHVFSWSDIVPCLPPPLCTPPALPRDYYENESHISKFIALVAVGTIAVTSVAFICVTVGRQPCWSESNYDYDMWHSEIDLEQLEASHDLRSPKAQIGSTSSHEWRHPEASDSEVDTSAWVAAQAQAPPPIPRHPDASAAATPPMAKAVGVAPSTASSDGTVWRTHGSLRLEVAGSSSDESVESFDSARDVHTATHVEMV